METEKEKFIPNPSTTLSYFDKDTEVPGGETDAPKQQKKSAAYKKGSLHMWVKKSL